MPSLAILSFFCGFPGYKPVPPGWFKICVGFISGTPKGSPKVVLTFCGFPWVETSTAGRVYDLCVYYMTGAPEGSPKVVLCGFMGFFMEKPGIEPATPGLQGIAILSSKVMHQIESHGWLVFQYIVLQNQKNWISLVIKTVTTNSM